MLPDEPGNLFESQDTLPTTDASQPVSAHPSGAEPSASPLADRLRPSSLEEFAGQGHLVGPGKLVRRILEGGDLPSLVLWGPPGTGKTTLAKLIAAATEADFVALSAVLSGVKEVRRVAEEAARRRQYGRRTILFIDEIHRFNKAQQDAFLPFVESGDLTLVGATTENPSFEIVSPLLSRCKVLTLESLDEEALRNVLRRALGTPAPRGLGGHGLVISDDLVGAIAVFADGDARIALTTLDLAARIALDDVTAAGSAALGASTAAAASLPDGAAPVADAAPGDAATAHTCEISEESVREAMQSRMLRYDKAGEEHYNLISALHKSVRNSDADASLYWLTRMIEGGEDPVYLARRLLRMASEDIGLADPQALPLAVAALQSVQAVGLPECVLALAEVAVYLSLAPKSNALYTGYSSARRDVAETANEPVPLQLRNAPTRLMKNLGYGDGYEYAHDSEEGVADMACLPESLQRRHYYRPTGRGFEAELDRRMKRVVEVRARRRKNKGARAGEKKSGNEDQ
jgi:putative ATPase